jgi:hypothetical protein
MYQFRCLQRHGSKGEMKRGHRCSADSGLEAACVDADVSSRPTVQLSSERKENCLYAVVGQLFGFGGS